LWHIEHMPKRSSIALDPNMLAAQVIRLAIEQPNKNPFAVELGRKGGLKGGKARALKLSSKRRRAIARKAAKARWSANG
jgi:hypothetical protein